MMYSDLVNPVTVEDVNSARTVYEKDHRAYVYEKAIRLAHKRIAEAIKITMEVMKDELEGKSTAGDCGGEDRLKNLGRVLGETEALHDAGKCGDSVPCAQATEAIRGRRDKKHGEKTSL